MESTPIKVGFIGLGKMGLAMATNLAKSEYKYKMKVYNRTTSKADSLKPLGVEVATDPTELHDVDILFSMVLNDQSFTETIVDSGLLAAMQKFRSTSSNPTTEISQPFPVHVSCTTLSVAFVQQQVKMHAENGVHYVSLPVIGRPDAAAAGKLHLLYAGEEKLLTYLQPHLVPTFGQSFRNYGSEPHKANVMKIVFNFTLASAIETISEGSALVQKYGIDVSDYTSTLTDTLFDCSAYKNYGNIIGSRAFQPAGATLIGVGVKDVNLALKAGEDVQCPLPFGSVMRDNIMEGVACGMAEWDWSAVAVVAEHHAGIQK